MEKQKGFTLVEAIVVAVIVAMLAAVAIPMYNSYIHDTQLNNARSNLELVGAAVMQTYNRGTNVNANNWTTIGINDPSDDKWTYSFGGLNANNANTSSYQINATGQWGKFDNKPGNYQPNQPAGSRWGGALSVFN